MVDSFGLVAGAWEWFYDSLHMLRGSDSVAAGLTLRSRSGEPAGTPPEGDVGRVRPPGKLLNMGRGSSVMLLGPSQFRSIDFATM